MTSRRLPLLAPALLCIACSGENAEPTPAETDAASDVVGIDASDGGADVESDGSTDANEDASDASVDAPPPSCIDATGTGTAKTDELVDGSDQAKVTVSGTTCQRTYVLSTTAPLRDSTPGNPRTIVEASGQPFVRTKNDLFDALWALAIAEAKEDSVDEIHDGAFESGAAIGCPAGGCFQTGRLWTYVWTRDTSYSVDLGLAAFDPIRAKNSLAFKLSPLRTGGGDEIVQDTGSGGSWPISSDRVTWAIGASELLRWLDGDARAAFRDQAWTAIRNTVERDRQVVFDPEDGLYRGEQSFLDWREQSYPSWTATDTVHLGMSKALSTNVAHLAILETAARLAEEKGDAASQAKYQGFADALRTAIAARLWLPGEKQFSSFVTTTLDPAPVRRFDALGTALAVLHGVGTAAQRKDAIASYPHLARGVPVIWPQQKETRIYHNRAIWPFVTAYVARAAKAVRNDAAVENAVHSLMRAAALNLSNMENLEVVSGRPWVDDGAYSGPVVNSQRQLWSVAGYLAMVQRVVFGVDAEDDGLRVSPFVTKKMRNGLFANADSIALNDLAYRGKKVSVVVKLPAKEASSAGGAYTVSSITLNGAPASELVAETKLAATNVIEVTLADTGEVGSALDVVTAVSDYKNLFAPRSPSITAVEAAGGNLRVTWDPSGETAGEVSFDVYRDGVRVASDLPGGTTQWTDTGATATGASVCYSVETTFASSKNHSQHSPPWCWWGTGASRVTTIGASTFVATGGSPITNYGKFHYEGWGDPGDTLKVASFVPAKSGKHWLQVTAGNGAGPIDTGITCGVKMVEVLDGTTVVARGYFLMPHLGAWSTWKDSSFVRADLVGGKSYSIVIRHDPTAVNMSFFSHFERYTGGTGGKTGAFSRVNVAELKILQVTP